MYSVEEKKDMYRRLKRVWIMAIGVHDEVLNLLEDELPKILKDGHSDIGVSCPHCEAKQNMREYSRMELNNECSSCKKRFIYFLRQDYDTLDPRESEYVSYKEL